MIYFFYFFAISIKSWQIIQAYKRERDMAPIYFFHTYAHMYRSVKISMNN